MKLNDAGVASRIDIDSGVIGNFTLDITGNGNSITIEAGVNLKSSLIEMRGDNIAIHIGADCKLQGRFRCRSRDAVLRIGARTTSMNAFVSLHEPGTITVGEDCMFSGDVHMDVSDMHSILDRETGARVNPARDIAIGDHVWLAHGVMVGKGAIIGSGAIIGAKSLVLGTIPENVIAAGTPARVLRENVEWRRQRL